MIATDFTRDDCKLGNRRISYASLVREYRCNQCEGRLTLKWGQLLLVRGMGWHIGCARCDSVDLIHENEIARQTHEAAEVLNGLPPELAALVVKGGSQ